MPGRGRHPRGSLFAAYSVAVALILGGIIMIAADPSEFGVDAFALAEGAGLSVLMINFLFRLGVTRGSRSEA
jgi:hypothetical protein